MERSSGRRRSRWRRIRSSSAKGANGAKAAKGAVLRVLKVLRVQSMVLCAALLAPSAPASLAPPAPLAPLALFLLGHRIGTERAEIARDGDRSILTAHFEYLDRGTKVALDTTLAFAKDFTPLSFESHGKSYRYFSVDASVPKPGEPHTFTLDGMAPLSAQVILIR